MNRPSGQTHHGALLPLGLGILAWAGINASYVGPAEFVAHPSLPRLRSLAPLLVLAPAAATVARAWKTGWRPSWTSPTALLSGFALIGLLGGLVNSPHRGWSAYWGLAFLAVVVLVLAFESGSFPRSYLGWALRVNWGIAVVIGLLLLAAALYTEGVVQEVRSGQVSRLYRSYGTPVVEALRVNANGAGRFAAITLIIAASRLLDAKRVRGALGWFVLSAPALAVLLLTVSRSAIVGLAVALAVLLLARLGVGRSLRVGGTVAAVVLVAGGGPFLVSLATRGQSFADVATFSGRPGVWQQTWEAAMGSPFIGFGFQADRFLLSEHVHNAALQALLQAGLLGMGLFLAAWVLAWVALVRIGLFRQFREHPAWHRVLLSECAAVLTFLTLRSIPESTGAFYGVDLLLVAPIFGYLHATHRQNLDAPAPSTPGHARPKVLYGAFACAPPSSPRFGGGEDLLGWSIPRHAADLADAHVLTDASNATAIDEETRRHRVAGLRFHYLRLNPALRPLLHVQGGIQLYAYLWQLEAFFVAGGLHDEQRYDVYHHITYANDWMASYPGAFLPIPFVRGPGGGAHRVPRHLAAQRGARFLWVQRLRTLLQGVLRMDPVFRRSRRRASRILVCTRESMRAIPARHRNRAEFMPVNGMGSAEVPHEIPARVGNPLRVLSVGKLLDLKAMDIAVRSFVPLARERPDARLEIIGDGPERQRLETLASQLGVSDQVIFAGWKRRAEVLRAMGTADVFLFPSLRDGGGAVVIEAMAMGLPVVCFDLAGPGLHVAEGCGIRISSHPSVEPVAAFTRALQDLAESPELRRHFGAAAHDRVRREYTWERLTTRLVEIYWQAMKTDGREPLNAAVRAAAMPTVAVLGTPISVTNQAQVLDFFDQAIAKRRKGHVCVCSVNNIMSAAKDPELRRAHVSATLCVPDGFPLARIARKYGWRNAGRVRGTDLVVAAAERAAQRGHRIFLYGGGPGVAEQMARRLRQQFHGLQIAGWHSPPFRALPPQEDAEVVAQINGTRPDVILVGLSTPKQEKWMLRNAAHLDAPLLVGVGAAFDFIAGVKRPAPRWVSEAGLEWLWRFLQEPRRLWRRVAMQGPAFLLLSWLENLQRPPRPAHIRSPTPEPSKA